MPGFTISIHAPLAGSDLTAGRFSRLLLIFQSTLPSRGATKVFNLRQLDIADFNPRSPRGERPRPHGEAAGYADFNPRSPRGERLMSSKPSEMLFPFQSTLPSRGATHSPISFPLNHHHFNPRSPRGERRSAPAKLPHSPRYFNPRSPRGERRYGVA